LKKRNKIFLLLLYIKSSRYSLNSSQRLFCLPHAGVFASKCGDRRRAVDEEGIIVLFKPRMAKYVLMSQPLLYLEN